MKAAERLAIGLLMLFMVSAFAMGQDETEVKGLITGRTGDTMLVQTSDGTKHTIVLTDDTKVRMPKGLGLRHKEVAWTNLIPGLAVHVKGMADPQGQITASQVDFNKDDLQTASMIQAGLAPTQQQVAENQQNITQNKQAIETNRQEISQNARETDERFASLADYDVKNQLSVYFTPGSSDLSDKDKAALLQLANRARQLQGYLIEVKGFADSSGAAAMNQTLSKDRAEAVINHLLQNCKVPARHVLAPGAMGISNPAASNETTQGRANNRRVEVKVMVNKGMAGPAAK